MSCNKIKATCTGVRTYAVCTQYEGTVNSDSSLDDTTCLNLEETTQDVYNQLEGISTEGLGELCLTYTLEEGKILVKNVLKKLEQEICDLKTKVEQLETINICNQNIIPCNLDFGNLLNACGNQPATLAETLQVILDNLNTP